MNKNIKNHRILIIDFGSLYTQLIARRIREAGVYCELKNPKTSAEEIKEFSPKGIILSGGPHSTISAKAPVASQGIFSYGIPILGICYGMQTMAEQLGGAVESSTHKEIGYAAVEVIKQSALFNQIEDHVSDNGNALLDVWMSHGD